MGEAPRRIQGKTIEKMNIFGGCTAVHTRLVRGLLIGSFGLATLLSGGASAAPITKTVTLQVYQFCDDAGFNCASIGPGGNAYFANETNKIWSQAGISVGFNFVGQINSTHFSNINESDDGDGFADLHSAYGSGGPSANTVDMFLVHTIAGAYGEGWLGAGGFLIAMDTVMAFNGGLGRIDTIAHELGHNLGLDHSAVADQLMASGNVRSVPATLADINPDGLGLDKISAAQINIARGSSLLSDVPEPFSMALVGSGMLAVVLIRRRRRA